MWRAVDTAAITASFLDENIRISQAREELGSEAGSRLGLVAPGPGLGSRLEVEQQLRQGLRIKIGDDDGQRFCCSDDIFNRRDMW